MRASPLAQPRSNTSDASPRADPSSSPLVVRSDPYLPLYPSRYQDAVESRSERQKTSTYRRPSHVDHAGFHGLDERRGGGARRRAPRTTRARAVLAARVRGASSRATSLTVTAGNKGWSDSTQAVHNGEREGRPRVSDSLTTPVCMTSTLLVQGHRGADRVPGGRLRLFRVRPIRQPHRERARRRSASSRAARTACSPPPA